MKKNLSLILAAFAAVASYSSAGAATSTWNTTTGNWNATASWSSATVPTSAVTTDLIFNTAAGYTSTDNIGGVFKLHSITLNATAGAGIILTDNFDHTRQLELNNDGATDPTITIVSTNTQANNLNIGLNLAANASIAHNGTGTLTYGTSSNPVEIKLGSNTLSFTSPTNAAGAITVGVVNSTTGGFISGAGSVIINRGSASTQQVMNGVSTYSGGTTFNNGTLLVGVDSVLTGNTITSGAFGTGKLTINITGTGGTLGTSSSITAGTATVANDVDVASDFTWGRSSANQTMTFSGTVTLTGNRTITVSNNTATNQQTISGVLAESGGARNLVKQGNSVLTFSGASANTYTGSTQVGAGVLLLNKTAGVNAIAGDITVGDNSGTATDTLKLGASNQIADTSIMTFSGTGSNIGLFTMNGNSEVIGGLVSSSSAGVIENALPGTTSTLTASVVSGGLRTYTGVMQDGATGTLAFAKSGAGEQALGGTSTYTGGTAISDGTLTVNSAGALGTAGNVSFGGGTLKYASGITTDYSARIKNSSGAINVNTNGGTVTFAGVIDSSNTGGVTKTGSGTLNLNGPNTFTGVTTISQGTLSVDTLANGGTASSIGASSNADTNLVFASGGTLKYTGASVVTDRSFDILNSNNATIDTANDLTMVAAIGTGNSHGQLTKTGAGTFTLTGTSTYQFGTTINGGTLQLGNGGTTGALNTISTAVINTGGTFAINRSNVASQGVDFSFGAMSGGGNFAQIGTGTTTLNAANTYSGGTAVSSGTLLVTGTGTAGTSSGTGTGAVTVNNSGTILGGTGAIEGNTTFYAGTKLTAGSTAATGSIGALNFRGALTLADSTASIELQAASTSSYDRFTVGGALTYNGALTFSNATSSGFNLSAQDGTYNLFSGFTVQSGNLTSVMVDSVALGNGGGVWSATSGNVTYSFSQSSGILGVTLAAVPEPSTWVGAGLLTGLAVWSQRKRLTGKSLAA